MPAVSTPQAAAPEAPPRTAPASVMTPGEHSTIVNINGESFRFKDKRKAGLLAKRHKLKKGDIYV